MKTSLIKQSILSITFVVIGFLAFAQCDSASFTEDLDQFFKTHVSNESIDYAIIYANPSSLNNIVDKIGSKDVSSFTRNEKLAFYINAYNVLVIKNVIDNYPITSPLKVKGFFKSITFNVAGQQLTLNDLENNKVRQLGDARIHFALVCGAKGCPPIIAGAYLPKTLNSQLDLQTQLAVNSRSFTRVFENKNVQLSQIFDWYKDDFVKDGSSLIEFINQYRTNPILTSAKVSFYEYNWNLNSK